MSHSPFALAKACFDIGYFTANCDAMLAFWRDEIGLPFEEPVEFNNGLTQYRHALGDSVIKINTSQEKIARPPTGYSELLIAKPGCTITETITDPDGNRIHFVPPGEHGIDGIGISLRVRDVAAHQNFFRETMRFKQVSKRSFRSGNSIVLLEPDEQASSAGHWVNLGLRYFTLHVMRVDECFNSMTSAGAGIGEEPYSIGQIARISFVRDPDGNWIEVAQRASLAGGWWEE
jgi:lactoylglutathione lyase